MDSICCVADAQGYCVKGKFIICELTFFNDSKDLHQVFRPDIDWSRMTMNERKTIQFSCNNIHGLNPHTSKELPSSKTARSVILDFFRQTYKEGKFVGVKNNQLEKELKILQIPYKRLDDAPKLGTLDERQDVHGAWTCAYHMKIEAPTPRCTVRKCYRIWFWLENSV